MCTSIRSVCARLKVMIAMCLPRQGDVLTPCSHIWDHVLTLSSLYAGLVLTACSPSQGLVLTPCSSYLEPCAHPDTSMGTRRRLCSPRRAHIRGHVLTPTLPSGRGWATYSLPDSGPCAHPKFPLLRAMCSPRYLHRNEKEHVLTNVPLFKAKYSRHVPSEVGLRRT